MIGLALACLVDARGRVLGGVEAEVAHVAENVPFRVLRPGVAEVTADPEVGGRSLTDRPSIDGETAHQGKAAAVDDLVADPCELRRQFRQREIGLGDAGDVGSRIGERPHGQLDLAEVLCRQSVNPFRPLRHVRPVPDGGAFDWRR